MIKNQKTYPGYFITLEGPDGTGKTTQVALTKGYLEGLGYEVVCTREPGGTEAAEAIRQFVLDPNLEIVPRTEAFLYLAARAEHVAGKILPALEAGKIVLCDRFADSTLVYQGFVRGLPLEELKAMTRIAANGLEPDVTLLLDGEPAHLLSRREERGVTDRFEKEGLALQEKVRAGFLALAEEAPERIKVIQAEQSLEAVQADIQAILRQLGK